MTDWELWGTFSVGDHLRRRAFVADVLLYDRLVIPVPPASDEKEWKRWKHIGWMPARQKKLLAILEPEGRLIRAPWTQAHRTAWEERYDEAGKKTESGEDPSAVRAAWAEAASRDVAVARDSKEDFRKRNGKPDEIDGLAHFTTRELLVDWSDPKSDTELFMGLPPVAVDAVAAYGSYKSFARDHAMKAVDGARDGAALKAFGWEFFVPGDSTRSDEDLLREAVELAALPETQQHRRLFHEWRRGQILAGRSQKEAVGAMESAIRDYQAAVRKSRIVTRSKYAFAIAGAATAAGAVFLPLLGVAGGIVGLGGFALDRLSKKSQQGPPVAAMFHDARRRFGWK